MRFLIVIALSLALSSCTRSFEVSVSFRGNTPVFQFHSDGLFSSEQMEVCILLAEVVDEKSERAVMSMRPRLDDCVQVARFDLGAVPRREFEVAVREPLKPGRTYEMQVIAEEGMGRSRQWSLPGSF